MNTTTTEAPSVLITKNGAGKSRLQNGHEVCLEFGALTVTTPKGGVFTAPAPQADGQIIDIGGARCLVREATTEESDLIRDFSKKDLLIDLYPDKDEGGRFWVRLSTEAGEAVFEISYGSEQEAEALIDFALAGL